MSLSSWLDMRTIQFSDFMPILAAALQAERGNLGDGQSVAQRKANESGVDIVSLHNSKDGRKEEDEIANQLQSVVGLMPQQCNEYTHLMASQRFEQYDG